MLANVAKGLSVLILATLKAKLKIETEDVLLVRIKVNFVSYILSTEKLLSTTISTFEAVMTLPAAVWQFHKFWLQTPVVISFFTNRAKD